MNTWLEKELENRGIGEVSVYYTIIVMGTFMLFACVMAFVSFIGTINGTAGTILSTLALAIWLGFLIRLYWCIIKIGRIKLRNRPGVEIFKFLQIAVVVITAFQSLPVLLTTHRLPQPVFWVLLAFDAFIVFSGLFFFPFAWLIGCKIPKKTYLDFVIIAAAIVVQIWTAF
jgi:hypothetical protein